MKKHCEYHEKATDIDKKIVNNELWLAEDCHNIATTFYAMCDYDRALEHYRIALATYIELVGSLRTAFATAV